MHEKNGDGRVELKSAAGDGWEAPLVANEIQGSERLCGDRHEGFVFPRRAARGGGSVRLASNLAGLAGVRLRWCWGYWNQGGGNSNYCDGRTTREGRVQAKRVGALLVLWAGCLPYAGG